MGKTVLVTGAAGALSGRFARHLGRDPEVDRVIAVDSRPPGHSLAGAEFVRADIRHPAIAAVLAGYDVDTVVHLDISGTAGHPGGGRTAAKETNVLGTLQLLGACQKTPSLRRLVVKSSTQVYGTSPREPAVFHENSPPKMPAGGGFAQDIAEIEGYTRSFARRRPDVSVTVLRFAHILGPSGDSPLAAYFRLPVLPTVLGYDPRLQFVHEDDAVGVLAAVAREPRRGQFNDGTFNVAGEGVLLLSQAARRLGRPTVPVLSPFTGVVGSSLGALGLRGVSAAQLKALRYGRVVRTTELREVAGCTLGWTTAETLADFAAVHGPGLLPPSGVARVIERIEESLRHG
ncbi:NAD-dependent epimerase/dehydratase family protein [Streptomyces sodiiphilus]|uniref:NAD-dependent epimerase/dehydratase family protein n=1 Tax=Streptomyces sodiiphilus TaxID=226217 RepID=A0ABN2PRJ8_9ACTN